MLNLLLCEPQRPSYADAHGFTPINWYFNESFWSYVILTSIFFLKFWHKSWAIDFKKLSST